MPPGWMKLPGVSSQRNVTTTASVMPAALSRLPLRAVAGVFIWCRPSTKAAAATSQAKEDDCVDPLV